MLSTTTCHTYHEWLREKYLTPKLWNKSCRRLMPSCCYSWLSLWSNKGLDPKVKTMSSDDCLTPSASGEDWRILVAFFDSPCDQTKKWLKTQNNYCRTPSASGGGWCLLVAFLGSPCDLISSQVATTDTFWPHFYIFGLFRSHAISQNKYSGLIRPFWRHILTLWHSCASCFELFGRI